MTKGTVACEVAIASGFKELLFYPDKCIIGDYEALRSKSAIASYKAINAHGVQAFMLPARIIPKVLKTYYPRQLMTLLLITQTKANYVLSALSKFRHGQERKTLNSFQQLKKRLMTSRLRNFANMRVNPEKKWSEADLKR